MKTILTLLICFITLPSFAAEHVLDMLNKRADGKRQVYSQDVLEIDVGDTVVWMPKSRGHNVEIKGAPVKVKFKSKLSKKTRFKFEKPGIYYYVCTPHQALGMIGLVVVGKDISNIEKIRKVKVYGRSKGKMKKWLAKLEKKYAK
ncbi:MAG: pseudoazurin [Rhodospirillaceae bacterium]|nr:pseudoazurin [Rhodospirillaceae bacterium]